MNAYKGYWDERHKLLKAIDCAKSNRDPLSEFSEALVASITAGERAKNRTQKGWDLELPDGTYMEVKYLANPGEGTWPNEHNVKRIEGTEFYALVVFLDLYPRAVHIFPMKKLGDLYERLGKEHIHKGEELHVGRLAHEQLLKEKEDFKKIGVYSIELPGASFTK